MELHKHLKNKLQIVTALTHTAKLIHVLERCATQINTFGTRPNHGYNYISIVTSLAYLGIVQSGTE